MGNTRLSWVRASYDGPSGRVETRWKRSAGQLQLKLTVPPNTTAVLKVSDQEHILISELKGRIQELPNEGGYRVYELQSGSYSF